MEGGPWGCGCRAGGSQEALGLIYTLRGKCGQGPYQGWKLGLCKGESLGTPSVEDRTGCGHVSSPANFSPTLGLCVPLSILVQTSSQMRTRAAPLPPACLRAFLPAPGSVVKLSGRCRTQGLFSGNCKGSSSAVACVAVCAPRCCPRCLAPEGGGRDRTVEAPRGKGTLSSSPSLLGLPCPQRPLHPQRMVRA